MRSRAVKAHRTMHPAPFLRRVYRIDQNDLTIAHEVLSSRRSTSVLLTQSDATMMATSGGLPLITTQLRGHVQSPNHTFVPYDGWANLMHKLGFQHPVSTSPNYSVTVATAPTWLRVRALEHVSEIMHVNFDGLGAFRCMLHMATMAKVPLTDDIRCLSEYTTNCESRDSAHDIHDPVHDNQKGQSSSPAHDNSNVTCRIMVVYGPSKNTQTKSLTIANKKEDEFELKSVQLDDHAMKSVQLDDLATKPVQLDEEELLRLHGEYLSEIEVLNCDPLLFDVGTSSTESNVQSNSPHDSSSAVPVTTPTVLHRAVSFNDHATTTVEYESDCTPTKKTCERRRTPTKRDGNGDPVLVAVPTIDTTNETKTTTTKRSRRKPGRYDK